MTIATTYAFDMAPQRLTRQAMQLAGVLGAGDEPSAAELTMAIDMLDTGLKSWQTAGKFMRQVERPTAITLTSGTATYALPADTISVYFPMALVTSSGTEYPVEQMSYSEYMELPDKTLTGTPDRCLVEYQASPQITLFYVPDGNVTSLKYTRSRMIRDFPASTTPDIHQRYLRALVLMLAVDLAEHFGKSDSKIGRLEQRYRLAMQDIEEDRYESGHIQFVLR